MLHTRQVTHAYYDLAKPTVNGQSDGYQLCNANADS